MLSLFASEVAPLSSSEARNRSREILVSALNKGIIPTWESHMIELPVMGPEDLSAVEESFKKLTTWTFLPGVLDVDATEFLFHAPDLIQIIRNNGQREVRSVPLCDEEWQLWLEIVSLAFHQNWNLRHPFSSFYGKLFGVSYRLSLIHGSTSPEGRSKLVLRKLAETPYQLSDFGKAELLEELVKQKKNILIAGATGSGKTSLLASLTHFFRPTEHVVVLEDTFEIFSHHRFLTRFLAGSTPETELKAYLAYSLRMSPDRILLGEMRSHEVIPFMLAMNTGHRGLMGTIHAASAPDAINRVALLFSLYAGDGGLNFDRVTELVCRNLEYVVFLEQRRVKEVIRILGSDRGIPFFETIISGPLEEATS